MQFVKDHQHQKHMPHYIRKYRCMDLFGFSVMSESFQVKVSYIWNKTWNYLCSYGTLAEKSSLFRPSQRLKQRNNNHFINIRQM